MNRKLAISSILLIILISGFIVTKVLFRKSSEKQTISAKSIESSLSEKEITNLKNRDKDLKKEIKKTLEISENNSSVKKNDLPVKKEKIKYIKIDRKFYLSDKITLSQLLGYYEKNGFDINDSISKKKQWPILYSLLLFNKKLAKELLATGLIDISKSSDAISRSISKKKDLELVKMLIDYGFDVNAGKNFTATPYMISAARGYDDICDLLYSNGADVFATYSKSDTLDIAIRGSNSTIKTLEKLTSHGLEFNEKHILSAIKSDSIEKIDYLLQNETLSASGENLLSTAITHGNVDVIKYFIENGYELTEEHYEISRKRGLTKNSARTKMKDGVMTVEYFVDSDSVKVHEYVKNQLEKKGLI